MVSNDEGSTVCIVLDHMPDSQQKRQSLVVRPSYLVLDLLDDIKRQYQYDAFDLKVKTTKDAEPIVLNKHKGKTLLEVGLKFTSEHRNILMIDKPGQTSDAEQSIVKKKKKPEAMNLTGVNNTKTNSNNIASATTTMNGDSEKIGEMQETTKNTTTNNTSNDDSNKKMLESDVGPDYDFDLELGASASPTESTSLCSYSVPPNPPALPMYEVGESSNNLEKNEGSSYGQLRKMKSLGEYHLNAIRFEKKLIGSK